MKRLFQSLELTGDGAFVVDSSRKIIYWNAAAKELTGFSADETHQYTCHAMMGSSDEQGRLICAMQCWVTAAGLRGQTVPSFDTAIRTKENGLRWVNMSTFIYPNGADDDYVIVHLFRDATRTREAEQFFQELADMMERLKLEGETAPQPVAVTKDHEDLTPREQEILGQLVRGSSTSEMAQKLVISEVTVRNHVRHIHAKLGVHSRLEAVAYAIRFGLVSFPEQDESDMN